MALDLARDCGAQVLGCTLSEEQLKVARERSSRAGLAERAKFGLIDYRALDGQFDRIVSVGMFEHVGKKNYEEFFSHIHRLLADDGVCLLHAIGRSAEAGPVNGFIRKHIFPGVDVATLSEVLPSIERIKLYVTDIEILRLHYAETLRHWAERLQAHRAEIIARYGEVLYRKWEYYFIGCEMGFRHEYLMVFQIQLAKKLATVPLTRDYIHEWEQSHKWVLPITAPEEVGDEEKRLARGGRHGT
jgi:cyclopropane-fatty-acyl-phospholipid synthase